MSVRKWLGELLGMTFYMTNDGDYFYAWSADHAIRKRPGISLYVVDDYGGKHHVKGTANVDPHASVVSAADACSARAACAQTPAEACLWLRSLNGARGREHAWDAYACRLAEWFVRLLGWAFVGLMAVLSAGLGILVGLLVLSALMGCETDPQARGAGEPAWGQYAGVWTGKGDLGGLGRYIEAALSAEDGTLTVRDNGRTVGVLPWADGLSWQWDVYRRFWWDDTGACWYAYGAARVRLERDVTP